MQSIGINFMMIVFLAVFGAMSFSAFWYSPKIFGNAWMKLTGARPAHTKDTRKMMLFTFFAHFAIALTLYTIIIWAGAITVKAGMIVGLWVGLGLSSMTLLIPYLWENRPVGLFMMTAGLTVCNTVFMSAIMAHLIGKFTLQSFQALH